MGLTMRWVGDEHAERVARTRLLCYAHSPGELPEVTERLDCQGRAKAGDYLMAEREGRDVGTATSLDMVMWVRGAPVKCQGVAWVGAIKTERRKATGGGRGEGVASSVMEEVLKKARDEGFVLSSLCPWRASFYEHFGYGLMERRCDWTVPPSVLPTGDFDGIRFLEVERDREALAACHQRIVEAGQCDLERPAARWEYLFRMAPKTTFVVVDERGGWVRGWMTLQHELVNGRDTLRAWHMAWEDISAFRRQLCFLGSLRDQYSTITFTTQAGMQVHRLLKETQVPHRGVTHATAEVKAYTRLQTRVLDHVRLIEAMKLPATGEGGVVVAVRETEGHMSKFRIDVEAGRAIARNTEAAADVEMTDRMWAAVALGDIKASVAASMGLVDVKKSDAAKVLDVFAEGPAPFCRDYF